MRAQARAVWLMLVAALLGAQSFAADSRVTRSSIPLREQLGQNLIVGIPGTTLDVKTEGLLRDLKPGGIVLYRRNFSSAEQLQKLISQLQELAQATAHQQYLILIDEEPGGATRLGLFRNVFAFGEPDWPRIEHDISTLHKLGINVELAPLADFPFNHDSFIKGRVPAHSVQALTEFNRRYIEMLNKAGVRPTLKHFPGMGVFTTDPHRGLPNGEVNARTFAASLKIFQDGINSGAELVMTGHAVYSNVDAHNPATLSHTIVTGLLRRRLRFRGLVITDDLSEMPLAFSAHLTLSEAAERALTAGHTMLLFSHQLTKTKEIVEELTTQAEHDPKLRSTIENNYHRVIAFKESHH